MICFNGDRSFLKDCMFTEEENKAYHKGSTGQARRLPEYEDTETYLADLDDE